MHRDRNATTGIVIFHFGDRRGYVMRVDEPINRLRKVRELEVLFATEGGRADAETTARRSRGDVGSTDVAVVDVATADTTTTP